MTPTDEQRKRIHEVLYSTDSREELAERIVLLEAERDMYSELVEVMDHPDTADQLREENAKLRRLLSNALLAAGYQGRQFIDGYLRDEEGTTLLDELKEVGIEVPHEHD